MDRNQKTIPIVPSDSSCASGLSCASGASCGSTSCASAGPSSDSDDPAFRLKQQGWILRTTIGEPRLAEVVENYRTMGYEVHVEYFGMTPANGSSCNSDESCTTCFDTADKTDARQAWGSVYVRPGQGADQSEDLF